MDHNDYIRLGELTSPQLLRLLTLENEATKSYHAAIGIALKALSLLAEIVPKVPDPLGGEVDYANVDALETLMHEAVVLTNEHGRK